MADNKFTGKQLLIQVGISVLSGVIVSYIMYKAMQPKDDETTTAARTATRTQTVTQTPEDQVQTQ